MEIKMFKMGFGESILLSEKDSCLLVDCGSESDNRKGYFKNVEKELVKYSSKSAIITHFHNDHINGFMEILNSAKINFDSIYIPYIFTVAKHPNQVDFELIKYFLNRINFPNNRRLTLWEFLKKLVDKEKNIHLLERKSGAFSELGRDFDVLWPVPEKLINKRLESALKKKLDFLSEYINDIYHLSDEISELYENIQYSDNIRLVREQIPNIDEKLQDLDSIIGERIATEKINANFKNIVQQCINSIRNNKNKSSIVCQNSSGEKVSLLTGDIPPEIMNKILLNEYMPSINIHKHYYAIKAPHHGTESGYSNFGCHSTFDYLLISNGETPNKKKRGQVTYQYNLTVRDYKILCTNTDKARCEYCNKPAYACRKSGDICGITSSYIMI